MGPVEVAARAPRQHGPALPPPFAVENNGAHWYHETRDLLVLNNFGDLAWSGAIKHPGGGYELVLIDSDPAKVMDATVAAAEAKKRR